MTNAYADLSTLKSASVLDITSTTYDSRLVAVLEDVSRWIDLYCGRHFYVLVTTRTFDGNGAAELVLPDLISVTSLKTDDNKDRTFENTWASSDYRLFPQNAEPTTPWGHPFTRVTVDTEAGTKTAFPTGMGTVEVQGKWGYREETPLSSPMGAGGIDDSATTVTVQDGSQYQVAQTILIDQEQMYITSISTNDLTVVRAVNGTTAAIHVGLSAVRVFEYPAGVKEACLIQAARLWKRKDNAFATDAGAAALAGLDPDVRQMLSPYRRLAVGSGV